MLEWVGVYALMTLSFVTAGIILIVLMMLLATSKRFMRLCMNVIQDTIAESLDENFATYTEEEEAEE